jgi:hypothetical protein
MPLTLIHDASDSQASEREIVVQPTQAGFDYGGLPTDIRAEVKASADEIRGLMNRTVFEVGAALTRIKDRLPHGQFGKWLLAEFGLTERTAQNYMNAAALVAKCETVSVLQPKTVYLLASPSTPEPTRQEIIERFDAGEPIPDRTVKEMIGQAKDRQKQEHRLAEDAAREAQLSPRTRRSRAQRKAKEEREHQEWERKRAEQEAATDQVADLLISHLPPEAVTQLRNLLRDCTSYKIGDALLERLKRGDLQPATTPEAGDPPAPESNATAAATPVNDDMAENDQPAESALEIDRLAALQKQYRNLSDQPGAHSWIMRRLCQGETPARDDNTEVAVFVRRFTSALAPIQNRFRAGIITERPVGAGVR